MKAVFLVFILYSQGTLAACLSGSLERPMNINFDLKGIEDTVQDFESMVKHEINPQLSLVINLSTLNNRVNAEINKTESEIIIDVMGGMISHPRMTGNVLRLLLCHEIGHLLGGPPLKSRNGWSSTEGQSDYYSARECVRMFSFNEETFFESALSLTTIYAEVTRETSPRLDSCEQKQVTRTNYGYPSVQCRLDTLVAGWNGQDRPRCWYRD
jgi:hypothetical protein